MKFRKASLVIGLSLALGAALPAAGVGCAFSRAMLELSLHGSRTPEAGGLSYHLGR